MRRAEAGGVAEAMGAKGSWNDAGMAQAGGRSGPFIGRTEATARCETATGSTTNANTSACAASR